MLNLLSSVLKGGLRLPLIQEADQMVPFGPAIVRFGGLRHPCGTY